MVDVDSWSMHVRSITSPAELQVAVRDFERNVERAVQMEQRAHQTPVKVLLPPCMPCSGLFCGRICEQQDLVTMEREIFGVDTRAWGGRVRG